MQLKEQVLSDSFKILNEIKEQDGPEVNMVQCTHNRWRDVQ